MNKVKFILFLLFVNGYFTEASAVFFRSNQRQCNLPEQLQEKVERVKAINASNSGKIWKPGHQILTVYSDDEWITSVDDTYTYDEQTGLLKESVNLLGERTTYIYNADRQLTEILTEELESGEWVTNNYITYKYDDILKDFVVETLVFDRQQFTDKLIFTNGEKTIITRNAQGYITQIYEEYYSLGNPYCYDGKYLPWMITNIDYNSEGEATAISRLVFDVFDWEWQLDSKLYDIVWDSTDGSTLTGLYDNNPTFFLSKTNRIKSATVEVEEVTGNLTASYPDENSFSLVVNNNDKILETWEYKVINQYNSFESLLTGYDYETPTGEADIYVTLQNIIYDEWNSTIYKKIAESVNDEIDELNILEADVTYDLTYGYPLKYFYTESFDGETFSDYAERIFGDYVLVNDPSDIDVVETDGSESAVYYNLQGMMVENPTPGKLYILRQGNKVKKVVVTHQVL